MAQKYGAKINSKWEKWSVLWFFKVLSSSSCTLQPTRWKRKPSLRLSSKLTIGWPQRRNLKLPRLHRQRPSRDCLPSSCQLAVQMPLSTAFGRITIHQAGRMTCKSNALWRCPLHHARSCLKPAANHSSSWGISWPKDRNQTIPQSFLVFGMCRWRSYVNSQSLCRQSKVMQA